MANTLQLKRRILTAQNVSKTTRAMQMIAASKMKRAQDATLASRPYVEKLSLLTKRAAGRTTDTFSHPYLTKQEGNKTLGIVISPDKGLCGGMITNLTREYVKLSSQDYVFVAVGKKAEKSLPYFGKNLIASFHFGNTIPSFDMVYPLITIINEQYLIQKVQRVEIISSKFVSIFTQKPGIQQLLPLSPETLQQDNKVTTDMLFEPQVTEILPTLLNHYLEMTLYQYLLESYVSEQAARMLAMQNATDNAKDIIEVLRLEYNKARQTRITSEILDISSAAFFTYA